MGLLYLLGGPAALPRWIFVPSAFAASLAVRRLHARALLLEARNQSGSTAGETTTDAAEEAAKVCEAIVQRQLVAAVSLPFSTILVAGALYGVSKFLFWAMATATPLYTAAFPCKF
jgi:hypothetical protein